jgi:two-component system chemotaxis sensor kinase CheA
MSGDKGLGFELPVPKEDRESWQDFLIEGAELLASVETQVLAALRNEPFDLMGILRPLHTLKGICGMLGLAGLGRLMHGSEDVLEPFKSAQSLPQAQAEAVLAVMDLLKAQLGAVSEGLDKGSIRVLDAAPLEARLQGLTEGSGKASPAAASENSEAPEEQEHATAARATDNVIRISVAKMDSLLEAVSELAICQAQVCAGVTDLGVQGSLSAEAARLEKISRALQHVVLGLRMVPVQPLFNRISRQVYDLGSRMQKPVNLELVGGDTEVDKGLVEELFEPLLHLVRNSLDHGLENAAERLAKGKSAEGHLRLAAFHQGGDFVLELSDDGGGFDLGRIANQARRRGLLGATEEPSEAWLLDQIFRPGFSTAEKVTDISGRGVGLDAVRGRVQALKGTVLAQQGPQGGAIFSLRLPLTMALMEAILVRAGNERFAFPASSVRRFLAWDASARHAVGGGEAWMEAAGSSLPLLDLGSKAEGRAVALHVAAGGREACVIVDEVLGKQQVVVKGLGALLAGLPGMAGGAVLADGRVGLILDLESLLQEQAA